MPHIIVKLWPGKSDQQKALLTRGILDGTMRVLGYSEDAISVAFEEVAPGEWDQRVHQPEIVGKWAQLTKRPGYGHGAADSIRKEPA